MSEKGRFDNAVVGSFFKTLKTGLLPREKYEIREERGEAESFRLY